MRHGHGSPGLFEREEETDKLEEGSAKQGEAIREWNHRVQHHTSEEQKGQKCRRR